MADLEKWMEGCLLEVISQETEGYMKTFVLPLPITTNHAYATSGGRWYKTAKAKEWEDEAGWIVKKVWKRKPIQGEVSVSMQLFLKRDRDIDGSIKSILDLFQRMGVYENDRQVISLTVDKFIDKENPRVEVTLS